MSEGGGVRFIIMYYNSAKEVVSPVRTVSDPTRLHHALSASLLNNNAPVGGRRYYGGGAGLADG